MNIFTPIVLLLLSVNVLAQSKPDLTAQQILDSSIKFCGGEKRITQIKTSSSDYLLVERDNTTAIVTEKRRTGQKYVQSILSKAYVPQTTFFDGAELSRVNGSSVVHVTKVETVDEVKLKTYDQLQFGYKALGYKLTRLPDKKFNNFDCYVVGAKADNGYSVTNFFDKTTYRLLMVVYPNGNKSVMIDYVFKDSVLFNSTIINTFVDSKTLQELRLQSVQLNKNISDLWFTCPYKDKVTLPPYIRTGKFESTTGEKTVFVRSENAQDYEDKQGKIGMRRLLKWANDDTYGLIDEDALTNNETSPESEILVRIISWNNNEYVCHWIAGKFTDTQDYKVRD